MKAFFVMHFFEQLDKAAGGTRMGLTMVQCIVEYYGGTIRVESDGVSQGDCFYFTYPMP